MDTQTVVLELKTRREVEAFLLLGHWFQESDSLILTMIGMSECGNTKSVSDEVADGGLGLAEKNVF